MNILDWVIVTILVVSVLSAAKSGFVVQLFSLGGAILGLILACWNFQKLLPWFHGWIHPFALAEILAFLLIVLGTMIVLGLLGRILRWSLHSIGLGWADRLAGAAFGLLKGAVLVVVMVVVVAAFAPHTAWLRGSMLAPSFLSAAHGAAWASPDALGQQIRHGISLIQSAPHHLFAD